MMLLIFSSKLSDMAEPIKIWLIFLFEIFLLYKKVHAREKQTNAQLGEGRKLSKD